MTDTCKTTKTTTGKLIRKTCTVVMWRFYFDFMPNVPICAYKKHLTPYQEGLFSILGPQTTATVTYSNTNTKNRDCHLLWSIQLIDLIEDFNTGWLKSLVLMMNNTFKYDVYDKYEMYKHVLLEYLAVEQQ